MQQDSTTPQSLTDHTPREHIDNIMDISREQLRTKELQGITPKLSKTERARLAECISQYDALFTRNGVNFSRFNFGALLHHLLAGGTIEFEALGPYLESYRSHGGVMTRDNLLKEDAIGLELAVVFRKFFPKARLISLYDDYNAHSPETGMKSNDSGIGDFPDPLKKAFLESLLGLYRSCGALTDKSVDGVDYLMIPESSKPADAQDLVARLEAKGCISRKGDEIMFVNTQAENPLHHRIHLRNSRGKWLCEALDAATFLKAENLRIFHIVALPDYMKDQQDKVWEMLRMLGISPHLYHNIFYSVDFTPKEVAQTVTDEFNRYL